MTRMRRAGLSAAEKLVVWQRDGSAVVHLQKLAECSTGVVAAFMVWSRAEEGLLRRHVAVRGFL